MVGYVKGLEYNFVKGNGDIFPGELSAAILRNSMGKPVGFVVITKDITERKRAEREVKESREFLSNVLSNAPNPMVAISPDSSVRYVNPAFERLTGFTFEEVANFRAPYPWWVGDLYDSNISDWQYNMFKEVSGKRKTFRKKDGELFWVDRTIMAIGDKSNLGYYLETWNDVTREKVLSENLQIYATEITKAQEEERRRIARELHDETIQALFSAVTDIEELKNTRGASSGNLNHRLAQLQDRIGTTIDEIRRFCHELRPGILDRFGLVPSLDNLVKEVNSSGKSKCGLEIAGRERRLTPEVELVLFRTAQEALRNTIKHSDATEVIIRIVFMEEQVELRVMDNGKGFMVPEPIGKFIREGKLGLAGMQERVRLIGGKLLVDSVPEKGVRVVIQVPTSEISSMANIPR